MVTGDRPTGPLHLGHYLGTLANRVRLQDSGIARSRVVIADYQVITDRDAHRPAAGPGAHPDRRVSRRRHRSRPLDHLRRTPLVPALNQLMLPFLSLVTDAELHRNPTVKAESLASRRSMSALLLTYPVHQAADILGLRRHSRPGRTGSAAAHRADQADRAPVQRPVRDRFRGAAGPAVRGAGGARHRRRQDVENPRATPSRSAPARTRPRR